MRAPLDGRDGAPTARPADKPDRGERQHCAGGVHERVERTWRSVGDERLVHLIERGPGHADDQGRPRRTTHREPRSTAPSAKPEEGEDRILTEVSDLADDDVGQIRLRERERGHQPPENGADGGLGVLGSPPLGREPGDQDHPEQRRYPGRCRPWAVGRQGRSPTPSRIFDDQRRRPALKTASLARPARPRP